MKYIIMSLLLASTLASAQTEESKTPQQKIETSKAVKQEQVSAGESQGEENTFEIGPYVNGEYEYFNRLKMEQKAAAGPEESAVQM